MYLELKLAQVKVYLVYTESIWNKQPLDLMNLHLQKQLLNLPLCLCVEVPKLSGRSSSV